MEIDVTDKDFDKEVIKRSANVPVVVDFWATWCGPCQALKPVLEKVAKNYGGKFILAKMNVDENEKTPEKYGIMSIPNVKLFKNGEIVDEFIGAMPEDRIIKWINQNL